MLPNKVTRRADRQIKEAGTWWVANRPKAPEAFKEELQRGFQLISQQPGVGVRATNVKLKGILRIHLSRIRYFLDYRSRASRIEVLSLWHSSRLKGPPL